MSTRSGNIKGFYKQKKTTTKTGISGTGIKKSPSSAATLGSDITQPPALLSNSSPHLRDEYEKEEEVLRQFDMNMAAYGPCLGMSRLARWERASVLGLNPPQQVHHLLLKAPTARSHCLWEGRI